MSIQDSIKAKLKNRAIQEKRTFNEILTVYALERMLYRLSISEYAKHYVLKGGILLYALYKGDFKRGTADVDLLGYLSSNDLLTIENSFKVIINLPCPEDGIYYVVSTLKVGRINELKKYPGVKVSIECFLSKTKISVQIDIGFGDVVHPKIELIDYPTLLDLPAPIIHTYSKESVIAEKFHAMVSLGYANTRMKDFYDIYALLNSYDFTLETLREAVQLTFLNRHTKLGNVVAFEKDYGSDPYKKRIWTSFIKSKNIESSLELDDVIANILKFLSPVLLKHDDSKMTRWDHLRLEWI